MKDEKSVEIFTKEIKNRFVKAFLDLLLLQLIKTEPMWGYKIIKKTETLYKIRLRHGALYPLLNTLEANGFLQSKKELQKGRVRRVYEITQKGKRLLNSYHNFLKEQIKE